MQPVYEPSPLNRIDAQYGAGEAWYNNSKSVKTYYLTNSASDCYYYYVSGNSLVRSGSYASKQLYVTKLTDKDENILKINLDE